MRPLPVVRTGERRLRRRSGVIPGEFLATSGRGGVSVIDARSGAVRPLDLHGLEAARWDNHLIEVGRT